MQEGRQKQGRRCFSAQPEEPSVFVFVPVRAPVQPWFWPWPHELPGQVKESGVVWHYLYDGFIVQGGSIMDTRKYLDIHLRVPLWWLSLSGHWRTWLPSRGNVLFTLLVVVALLWATNAGALPLRAPTLAGDSTTTISYQGRLADSTGNPITTSGVGMQFRLYNTDTGGSPLWEESHTAVPVEDGLFHVLLGSTDPIPVSLLANNSTLWLGITVGADSEMAPREQIASVPYAMIASTVANGAITTEKIADEAVTQAKLGADVSLEPADGSITTEKLADTSVTSRKLAPIIKRAGASNEIDRAGSEWTDLEDVSISLSASEVPVASTLLIAFWCEHRRSAYGRQENYFRILVDGNQVGFGASGWSEISGDSGWRFSNLAMFEVADVSAGAHTVKVQRYHPGGGARFKERVLTVMVVAQQQ
jgi:hypothetical protein